MTVLQPINDTFDAVLQPLFPSYGLPYSILDVASALRLCLILRQLRISFAKSHSQHETRSWSRDVVTTLTVVFGGEAIWFPLVGVIPGWLKTPLPFALFLAAQAFVDMVPTSLIPRISWKTELPLSLVDGFSRAFLLCDLIPPVILGHADTTIANSTWSLLFGSLVIANGGFFLTSLFSLLHPTSISLRTPPELLPYGWLTVDLWVAPIITAFYAGATGSQPYLRQGLEHVNGILLSTGISGDLIKNLIPQGEVKLTKADARALSAAVLASIFIVRTLVNLGPRLPSLTFNVPTPEKANGRPSSLIMTEGRKKKPKGSKTKTQ